MKKRPLSALLCCPKCKEPLQENEGGLECSRCGEGFERDENGILDFSTAAIQKQSSFFRHEWLVKLQATSERQFERPRVEHQIDVEHVTRHAGPVENQIVLDAGCGTGLSTMSLLARGARLIFIDIVPETLQLVQKLVRLNGFEGDALYVVGDISCLPLKTRSIDIVWSGGVLEHFRDLRNPFIEIYRVLKQEGQLLFTVPNKFGLQRVLSSLKDLTRSTSENHYETGFTHYHLARMFPATKFRRFGVRDTGIRQFFHQYLAPHLPVLGRQESGVLYRLYSGILKGLSRVSGMLHLGPSWFLVHGEKWNEKGTRA